MAAVIAPICCFQRIVLYETKARFYLVGSNNAETRFRVLKIDRTEPKDLVLSDDKVEYNRQEIKQLLTTINAGNIIKTNKPYETNSKGLHRSIAAFGILGFVRFLEGYYIILITERRKQAQIGGHTIYKIEDTRMISIPNEAIVPKIQHPDESRYVKIFQNVDLSSNFYYSYSYDLTHTLQHNMAPLLNPNFAADRRNGLWESWRCCTCENNSKNSGLLKQQNQEKYSTCTDSNERSHECNGNVKDCDSEELSFPNGEAQVGSNSESKCSVNSNLYMESKTSDDLNNSSQKDGNSCKDGSKCNCNSLLEMQKKTTSNPFNICQSCKKFKRKASNSSSKAYMSKACYKFVWNKYFLNGFEGKVHSDWVLHIVNGFIAQSNICVYGKPVYVTLIARRSAEFAGTRFLKRGANDEGYVANEVETEQIVHDASVLSFQNGRFTSYVQLRGSVPTYWSQDMKQVMVPKPQINVDRADPFCNAASKHVNNLLERFGAPLVILNLVKKRERKRHEQILSEELQSAVEYLNQFLPVEHHIKYIGWDMARSRKSKDLAVIEKLTAIADQVFKTTGFFHNCSDLYCNQVRKDPRWDNMGGLLCNGDTSSGRAQNGVLRVNCVDCLDRTNTAQFMVGKCALGFQLYSLGVIDSPSMEFDSDAVRILEDLYEAHGDTLALQYGGSQLVHGIRTYRKVSPLTSHTHDIMQTISRYYSNAFNDADKQQAINIFLGVFVPREGKSNVWDMMTDYYLHHSSTCNLKALKKRPCYTSWLDEKVLNALPYPAWEGYCVGSYQPSQNDKDRMCLACPESVTNEEMDIFSEFYRPHVFTMFDTIYPLTMQRSCKDFMPAASNNHSPFIVRDLYKAPTRRRVPVRKDLAAAPGIPADDSSSEDGSSDDDNLTATSPKSDSSHVISFVSFQDLMPSMKEVYGVDLNEPNTHDKDIYESYSKISKDSEVNRGKQVKSVHHVWKAHQLFSHDSVRQVKLPSVESNSVNLYTGYTQTNHHGNLNIRLNSHSINLYREFANHYQKPLIEA